MQIKKAGGKIFGASLTAAEQKAMNMEIQRQLVEYDRKNELELDAIILWELHTQLGGVLACPRTIRIRTKRAIPTRQRMKPCEKSTRRMPVFTDFLTRSSIFASWQASESKAVLC